MVKNMFGVEAIFSLTIGIYWICSTKFEGYLDSHITIAKYQHSKPGLFTQNNYLSCV